MTTTPLCCVFPRRVRHEALVPEQSQLQRSRVLLPLRAARQGPRGHLLQGGASCPGEDY